MNNIAIYTLVKKFADEALKCMEPPSKTRNQVDEPQEGHSQLKDEGTSSQQQPEMDSGKLDDGTVVVGEDNVPNDNEGEASSSTSGGAVGGAGAQDSAIASMSSTDELHSFILTDIGILPNLHEIIKSANQYLETVREYESQHEKAQVALGDLLARFTSGSKNSLGELDFLASRLAQLLENDKGLELMAALKSTVKSEDFKEVLKMAESLLSPPTSPLPDKGDDNANQLVKEETPLSKKEEEGQEKVPNDNKNLEHWYRWYRFRELAARVPPSSSDKSTKETVKSAGGGEPAKPKVTKTNVPAAKLDDVVTEKTLPQSSISIKKYGTPQADSPSKGSKPKGECPHAGCPPPQGHFRDWRTNDSKCVCGLKFCNMTYLEVHINMAKGAAPFKCDQCLHKADRKCSLTKRKEEKRQEEKPKQEKVACQLYECTRDCGKLFSTKGKMFEHQAKTGRECKHANAQNPPVPKFPSRAPTPAPAVPTERPKVKKQFVRICNIDTLVKTDIDVTELGQSFAEMDSEMFALFIDILKKKRERGELGK